MPRNVTPGDDENFMRLALAAAAKGRGRTHPNPAVGAVIVRAGRVLATGWHRGAGKPHAEIEALAALASPRAARGATLYVTLEPCSTHGRTPPCTEAIVQAGLRRVVYGATDPNPLHAGRADSLLRSADIDVTSGVLAARCADLNRDWNKWIATGLPFVTAKAGMSLDGRISSHPSSRWITGPAARRDAMRLRAECGAILVGARTVAVDDPHLTLRGIRGQQPLRVIWSPSGRVPRTARVFTDDWKERTLLSRAPTLEAVLRALAADGVTHVLIEGGGRVLGEAFDRRLIDRVVVYVAPVVLGGPVPFLGGLGAGSLEAARDLDSLHVTQVGDDLRIEARVRPASSADSEPRRSTRPRTAARRATRPSNP